MTPTTTPRYGLLDAVRGLAALAVVFWHWQVFWWDRGELLKAYNTTLVPLARPFSPFYNYGWFAVDLFFVLSGFVFFWLYSRTIANGEISALRFAWLRFSRLYPLYFVTLIVTAAAQFAYREQFGQFFMFQVNDAYHFALNLVMANAWGFETDYSFNGPSWSVSVEVLLYAVFYAMCRARAAHPLVLLGTIALTVWLGVEGTHLGRGIAGFFSGGLVFYLTDCIQRRGIPRWPFYVAAVVAIVVGAVGSRQSWWGAMSPIPLYRFVVFPAGVTLLVLIEMQWPRLGHRLSALGDISYSSYLWHFPLQLGFAFALTTFGLSREVFYSPWTMVAFFGLLIPLSFVSFRYFERPLQSRLRQAVPTRFSSRTH